MEPIKHVASKLQRTCERCQGKGMFLVHAPDLPELHDTLMICDCDAGEQAKKQKAKYDALVAELRHIIAWGQSVNPDVLSEHQRSYRKGKVTAALDALVAAGELSPDDLPIVEGVTETAT